MWQTHLGHCWLLNQVGVIWVLQGLQLKFLVAVEVAFVGEVVDEKQIVEPVLVDEALRCYLLKEVPSRPTSVVVLVSKDYVGQNVKVSREHL